MEYLAAFLVALVVALIGITTAIWFFGAEDDNDHNNPSGWGI